jgi:hypothetical protein
LGDYEEIREQDRSVDRKSLEIGGEDRPFADQAVKSAGTVKIDQFVIVRVHTASFFNIDGIVTIINIMSKG